MTKKSGTKASVTALIKRLAKRRRELVDKLGTTERDLRAAMLSAYKDNEVTAIELAEISGLQRANVYDWLRREKGYKARRKKKKLKA